jgi:hypothetical protein
MADQEYLTCRGWLGTGTDKAHFIHPNATTVLGFWVPKSQVKRMTKFPPKLGQRTEVELEVARWLVDKNYMHEIVKQ